MQITFWHFVSGIISQHNDETREDMTAKKERQLNYELLRIVAMIMIVCLHYLSKGGLLGDPARADLTATGYVAWLVEALCLVAVNVYVLISGYFGVKTANSQTDERAGGQTDNDHRSFLEVLKRPLRVWRQVFFYSMGIGLIALMIGAQQFDLYQFFSYCLPIVTEHYWFATSYVVLCLLMPFLNAGVMHLKQRETGYLIAGLLVIFSVSKTVIPMQLPWDKYGYDLIWFIILYLTGAYLRRYEIKWLKSRFRAIALYLGSAAVIFASFFVIRMFYLTTGKLEDLINYGYTYNFLFCYTGAIGLFFAFAQDQAGALSERFRKPIVLFSKATFGVYLIHEHMNIRNEWPKWFHCEAQPGNTVIGFLAHMIFTVLAVYLICTGIELLRIVILSSIKNFAQD